MSTSELASSIVNSNMDDTILPGYQDEDQKDQKSPSPYTNPSEAHDDASPPSVGHPTPCGVPLDTSTAPTPAPSAPVQAYAKLEGEDFCYYIRTLQVTLGRKAAASTPNNVDIPLGNTKSVSRHHARLFYNFTTQRFEMMVFGKNGALVNERFVECGATVPLENRTKIQIGDVAFVFLLPRLMDLDDKTATSNEGVAKSEKGDYISTPRQLEKNSDIITTTLDHLNKKQRKRPLMQKKQRDDEGSSPTPGSYSDKNIKPPYSYAAIIAQAINSCPEKKMTLSSIYAYITHQYPYYQMTQNGWQNSIRHNLSLNKAFIKVPRQKDEPGKGAFWAIDPNVDPQFLNGIYKRNKRSSPQKTVGDTDIAPPGNDDDMIVSPTEPPPEKRIKLESTPASPVMETKDEPLEQEKTELVEPAPAPSSPPPMTNTSEPNHTKKESTPPLAIIPPVPQSSAPTSPSHTPADESTQPGMQTQLQVQLQQTIRQHLLDPVRHPLPPSIAQLLPQAIAQLPPALRTQLSATLQAALNAHQPQQPPTESSPTNEKSSS